MISFQAEILKFGAMAEKTGWQYIEIPPEISDKLNPGVKKAYRIKGKIDHISIQQTALLPTGNGIFILPINSMLRKKLKKQKGNLLNLTISLDTSPLLPDKELLLCLDEEPEALAYFHSLTPSHKNYFSKWIESAKTEATKTKRIAQTINALMLKMNFGEMIRANKKKQ
jgi:hypothetical protein